MSQVTYPANELGFERSCISDAALQVAGTLQEAGFDGYLVGGCVRDLLLGRRPKDFDITTNASPEQVKQLFRRSRIIGRRFKLVHVRFGREIIEVATYRAKPDGARAGKPPGGRANPISDSGRVVDDNVFGTIEQDAARRDFTINALYYDPNRELVLDFLGGVKDARKNTLRMIGNATARFTEDPVRMLRTLRFRAKLGLSLESGLKPAIADCLELLEDVPAARLFDETLKMFHHGHALTSWNELRSHNLVEKLFPLTAAVIAASDSAAIKSGVVEADVVENDVVEADVVENDAAESKAAKELIRMALENTDRRISQGQPVIAAFLFAVLLWKPFTREFGRQRRSMPLNEAVWAAGDIVFGSQSRRVAMPRRVSGAAIEIWAMQFQLERCRPGAVAGLLVARRFRAAFDFLVLRQRVGEVDEELARWWTDIQECDSEQQHQMIENLRGRKSGAEKKPPRRRRRKKNASELPAAGA